MQPGGTARIRWGARTVDLRYDTSGCAGGPSVILVAGMGRPGGAWPAAFVRQLGDAGLRVVVYDHRETGQSERLPDLPRPVLQDVLASVRAGQPAGLPYDLEVLAADLVQLMDHLGLDAAHLVGASMGGMLAQIVAARHPARVRSLGLLRTSSGQPGLPPPDPAALAAFAAVPPADAGEAEAIRYETGFAHACAGAAGLAASDAEAAARAMVGRGWFADGIARHLAAVVAAGDRRPLLARVRCPALVVHGTHDRLVHPQAGQALAQALDARLLWLEGAGHELPPPHVPAVVAALSELIAAGERQAPL